MKKKKYLVACAIVLVGVGVAGVTSASVLPKNNKDGIGIVSPEGPQGSVGTGNVNDNTFVAPPLPEIEGPNGSMQGQNGKPISPEDRFKPGQLAR